MRSKMFYMKDILKKRTVKMSKFWTEAVRNAKPYIPGEQLNQPNLLKLNTNENPYPPSPNVIKAINKELGDSLRLFLNAEVQLNIRALLIVSILFTLIYLICRWMKSL